MADERTVPSEMDGVALDAVVRRIFDVSWGKARGWIETGKVSLDGKICMELRAPVRAGIVLRVDMNAARPLKKGIRAGARTGASLASLGHGAHGALVAIGRERLIFADTQLVVVDKPSGISTVPYEPGEKGALVDEVAALLGQRKLEVVQRLDRETSGLLVFARTREAARLLGNQFRFHSVHRRYLALAHGRVLARTIKSLLVANRGDGLRGSARGRVPRGEGQEAVTHVEVREQFARAALIECRLETGRTHQIRIHLSEGGNPLVGERVYVREFLGEKIEANRLMLHAAELGFLHPVSQVEMKWTRPPPEDFEKIRLQLAAQ